MIKDFSFLNNFDYSEADLAELESEELELDLAQSSGKLTDRYGIVKCFWPRLFLET